MTSREDEALSVSVAIVFVKFLVFQKKETLTVTLTVKMNFCSNLPFAGINQHRYRNKTTTQSDIPITTNKPSKTHSTKRRQDLPEANLELSYCVFK